MKILSKKKYNQLLDKMKVLEDANGQIARKNKFLQDKLEDKETSCKVNSGRDFCFKCENSYRYKAYWGGTEYEKCGCLLNVPCEDFKRKESE